jgi:hypothetical protein
MEDSVFLRIAQSVCVFSSSCQAKEFKLMRQNSYEDDQGHRLLDGSDGFGERKFVTERRQEFPLFSTSHVIVLWTIGKFFIEMTFINYFPLVSSPPTMIWSSDMILLTRVIEQKIRSIKIHNQTVMALLKYPGYIRYITSINYNNKFPHNDEPQYPVPCQAEKGNHWCLNCKNYGTRRCEGCQQVYYCGLECQTDDWKRHKRECKRAKKLKKKKAQETHTKKYQNSSKKCVVCQQYCEYQCPCKQVSYCGEKCQRSDWPRHITACQKINENIAK